MQHDSETLKVPIVFEMEEIEMLEGAKAKLFKLRGGPYPISFEDVVRVLVDLGMEVFTEEEFTTDELAKRSSQFEDMVDDVKKLESDST